MPTSLSNIKVTDGQNNLVITGNDITINGTSILGQNNYVTLDTTQTITGVKTFSNTIKSTRQGDGIFLTRKSSTDSTGDAFVDLKFFDTLGNRKGGVRNILENGNTTCLYVTNEAGNAIKNTLNLVYNESSDRVYTSIINPEINSLNLRTNQYNWGTNPTTGTDLLSHNFRDNTDTPVVSNRPYLSSNGDRYYFISVINKEKTKYTELAVGWDASGNANTVAPIPTSTTSTSSRQIATTGWVNTVGNNVVHLTGNETITGAKWVNNSYIIRGNGEIQFTDTTGYTPSNPPSESKAFGTLRWGVGCTAGNTSWLSGGSELLKIQPIISSQGKVNVAFVVFDSSGNSKELLDLYSTADGSDAAAITITPSNADNSRKIATTAYVNNKLQVVSALPASPDSNTFYFIPA